MTEEQASAPPEPSPPVVDPSPAQPAIPLNTATLDDELAAHPAEASPPEVLELEPNRYEDATEGPHPQISQIAYVHMTKPDGSDFIVPLSNVEYYERKGFTRGADEVIPDLVAYQAERAAQAPSGSP